MQESFGLMIIIKMILLLLGEDSKIVGLDGRME
jgi:hypothetical protein